MSMCSFLLRLGKLRASERKLRNFIAIFNYRTSIPNSPFRKGFCRPYRKAKNFHSVWIENAWRVWARKVHVHNERLEPPYFAGATDSGLPQAKRSCHCEAALQACFSDQTRYWWWVGEAALHFIRRQKQQPSAPNFSDLILNQM